MIIRALALLLCFVAGAAQAGTASAPFLWDVRSPGGAHHYLLGSIHLLPQAANPLPPAIEKAYAQARTLVFESDVAALSTPEMQQQLLAAARGAGLRREVPAALYQRLQARAGVLGLPVTVCDAYTAWFCALTLELAAFRAEGFDAEHGIDQQLYERALRDDKELLWFEAPQQHLQLFTRMGNALGTEFLRSTLDDDANPDEKPAALFAAWQRGDDAFVERLVARTQIEAPQLHRLLLIERNRSWMPRLVAELRKPQTHLVVVGAAHLYGPDGLLAALRREGFELRSVGAAAP